MRIVKLYQPICFESESEERVETMANVLDGQAGSPDPPPFPWIRLPLEIQRLIILHHVCDHPSRKTLQALWQVGYAFGQDVCGYALKQAAKVLDAEYEDMLVRLNPLRSLDQRRQSVADLIADLCNGRVATFETLWDVRDAITKVEHKALHRSHGWTIYGLCDPSCHVA